MAWWKIAATVATAVGTVIQAKAAYDQGKAQKQMYEYNAKIQEQNQVIADQKVEYDKIKLRQRQRKLEGKMFASLAKSGVSLYGTPMDMLEELAMNAAGDIVALEYNNEMQKRGYKIEAAESRMKGSAAYEYGKSSAVGTLLTGAGSTISLAHHW